MQGPPLPGFNNFQGAGVWAVPTRPVVTDERGYITNANGTIKDWAFLGSASMPTGATTLQQYFSVTQVAGVPVYTGAQKGALAYDSIGLNLYVFNGTTWNLLSVNAAPNWAAVLAAGNNSGANNPLIDNPQQILYLGPLKIGAEGLLATAVATSLAIGRDVSANGIQSVAIGDSAFTSGSACTAVGKSAVCFGNSNTSIGASSNTGAGSDNNVTMGNFARVGFDCDNSVVIGHSAFSGNSIDQAVVLGQLASNGGPGTVVIGATATNTSSLNSVLIGKAASIGTGATNVVIGSSASAVGACTNAVIIGQSATADAASSTAVVIGRGASVNGTACIAIGDGANSSTTAALALGVSASCTGTTSAALGSYSTASALFSLAVGYGAIANSTRTTAVGTGAGASANGAIAIGYTTSANNANSIAIGQSVGVSTDETFCIGARVSIGTGCTGCTVLGAGYNVPNSTVDFTLVGRATLTNSQSRSTVVGTQITSSTSESTILGSNIVDEGTLKNILIGVGLDNDPGNSFVTMVGTGLSNRGAANQSVLMGFNVVNGLNNTKNVLIGTDIESTIDSFESVFIGSNVKNFGGFSNYRSVAIGSDIQLGPTSEKCIVIGHNNSVGSAGNTVALGNDITTTANNAVYFSPSLAQFGTAGTVAVYYNLATGQIFPEFSNGQYKTERQPIAADNRILEATPLSYLFSEGKCSCPPQSDCKQTGCKRREIGLLAEEMVDICPELVGYDKHGTPCSISYARIPVLLIPIIKELKSQVEELKQELSFLKQ